MPARSRPIPPVCFGEAPAGHIRRADWEHRLDAAIRALCELGGGEPASFDALLTSEPAPEILPCA